MRELKFRMWSKEVKKFFFDPENVYHCLKLSKNEETSHLYEDMVWQQYTGLKDKNGKEIYEGDRVRFGYTKNEDFFGEVTWLEDRASFGVKSKNAFETFEDLMDYMKYFEVVGNIFQLPCNPDHNGECLVCDCWLSDCQFLNKEQQNYEKL
jgi:uncharacterized phage protein (TIGR01671 family)